MALCVTDVWTGSIATVAVQVVAVVPQITPIMDHVPAVVTNSISIPFHFIARHIVSVVPHILTIVADIYAVVTNVTSIIITALSLGGRYCAEQ
jgi:hypothetical protein